MRAVAFGGRIWSRNGSGGAGPVESGIGMSVLCRCALGSLCVTLALAAGASAGRAQAAPPPRPLSEARLEGAFRVNNVVISAAGISNMSKGKRFVVDWTFAPLCKTGPCAVQVEETRTRDNRIWTVWSGLRLGRTDTTYAGHMLQELYQCFLTPTPGVTTIRLRVTSAKWRLERWVATRVVGTYGHAVPKAYAVFQCPAAHFEASISGVLLYPNPG
jgi:hypothetical protein